MSRPLVINGVTYAYPETRDQKWGPDATNWAVAVTGGMLQKSGGLFQLLAELDFGTAFGIKSLYYKSRTANVASAGQIRLANADSIKFRNAANGADLGFGPGSADAIPQWNSIDLVNLSTAQTLTNKTLTAPVIATIVNSGTLTLPTSTDTLVGRATTDTLTNKSMSGSSNTFTNLPASALLGVIKADGSVPLTANWAAGAFQVSLNSLLIGSAANQISGLRTIASDTSLTFQANGSTTFGSISAAGLWTLGAAGGTQAHVGNGSLSLTGALTAVTSFTGAGAAASSFTIKRSIDDGDMTLCGGISSTTSIQLYGGSHASSANNIVFNTASAQVGSINSSGRWVIGAGSSQTHVANGLLQASVAFITATANPASAGQFRLARADSVTWRNQANSGDLNLAVNTSDKLTFNGVSLIDATLTSAHILVGNVSNVATDVAMTGDVTISNAGVTAIGTNKVANTQLAQMATHTIKGNSTAGTANAADLTVAQVNTLLNTLLADGSVALSTNWNAGANQITANSVRVGSAANTIADLNTITSAADMTIGPTTSNVLNLKTAGTNRLQINSTGQVFVSNYDLTASGSFLTDLLSPTYQDTAGGANPSNTPFGARLDLSSTTPYTGAAIRLAANSGVLYRQVSASTTDTLNSMSAVLAYPRFNIASGQTYTNTGTGGIAGLRVVAPTNDGAGTLAITNFSGISISANAVASGTRAHNIFLGRYSGATNNAAITDNLTYTGTNFISQTGTDPSSFGGSLTAPSFIPSSSTIPVNGMYLPAANTVGIAGNSAAVMAIRSTNTGQVALGNTQAFWQLNALRNSKLSIWSTSNDRWWGGVNENGTNGSRLYLGVSSGAVGTAGYPASGATLGAIDFVGGDTAGNTYQQGASIDSLAGSLWSSTNREATVRVFTVPSASTTQTLAATFGSDQSLTVAGNIISSAVGKGFQVKEGSNAKMGTATLNGTTAVVVSNTSVTATSRIFVTTNASGGTVGVPYVDTRSAGTSFSLKSTNAADTSTVAWVIFEPSA